MLPQSLREVGEKKAIGLVKAAYGARACEGEGSPRTGGFYFLPTHLGGKLAKKMDVLARGSGSSSDERKKK